MKKSFLPIILILLSVYTAAAKLDIRRINIGGSGTDSLVNYCIDENNYFHLLIYTTSLNLKIGDNYSFNNFEGNKYIFAVIDSVGNVISAKSVPNNDIDLSGTNNFIYSNNFYYLLVNKYIDKRMSEWNASFNYYVLYKLSPDIKIVKKTYAKYIENYYYQYINDKCYKMLVDSGKLYLFYNSTSDSVHYFYDEPEQTRVYEIFDIDSLKLMACQDLCVYFNGLNSYGERNYERYGYVNFKDAVVKDNSIYLCGSSNNGCNLFKNPRSVTKRNDNSYTAFGFVCKFNILYSKKDSSEKKPFEYVIPVYDPSYNYNCIVNSIKFVDDNLLLLVNNYTYKIKDTLNNIPYCLTCQTDTIFNSDNTIENASIIELSNFEDNSPKINFINNIGGQEIDGQKFNSQSSGLFYIVSDRWYNNCKYLGYISSPSSEKTQFDTLIQTFGNNNSYFNYFNLSINKTLKNYSDGRASFYFNSEYKAPCVLLGDSIKDNSGIAFVLISNADKSTVSTEKLTPEINVDNDILKIDRIYKTARIYNSAGSLVAVKYSDPEINISGLSSGIYLIVIDGNVFKFFK